MWRSKGTTPSEISHCSDPLWNNGITVSGMMEKGLADILQILLVCALLTFLACVFFSEFISGVITVIIMKYRQELAVVVTVMKNSFENPHRNSLYMSSWLAINLTP